MTVATSPRLHLELMLARILVPLAAEAVDVGTTARTAVTENRGAPGSVDGPVPTETRATAGGTLPPVSPAETEPSNPLAADNQASFGGGTLRHETNAHVNDSGTLPREPAGPVTMQRT